MGRNPIGQSQGPRQQPGRKSQPSGRSPLPPEGGRKGGRPPSAGRAGASCPPRTALPAKRWPRSPTRQKIMHTLRAYDVHARCMRITARSLTLTAPTPPEPSARPRHRSPPPPGRRPASGAGTAPPAASRWSPCAAPSPAWRALSSTTTSASLPGASVPIRSADDSASALPRVIHQKALERVELLAAQRQHLVALVERAQHRVVGAAADVGGDRPAHALLAQADLVEEAAAEEEVGGRAEDRHRAARRHRRRLALGEMDRSGRTGSSARAARSARRRRDSRAPPDRAPA